MGKLLDADLLLAELRERKSDTYWGADDSDPFAKGVVYAIEHYIHQVTDGRYDAPEELQPKPPRQTLVEALEGAEVGTRFRHKEADVPGWVVVVNPGLIYISDVKRTARVQDHYADGDWYADEFIIEYPTY